MKSVETSTYVKLTHLLLEENDLSRDKGHARSVGRSLPVKEFEGTTCEIGDNRLMLRLPKSPQDSENAERIITRTYASLFRSYAPNP